MRRVLVPLDGSILATQILPDACRLAGPMGELVLVRDANRPAYDPISGQYGYEVAVDFALDYLEKEAAKLRADGVNVRTEALFLNDVPAAIGEAARVFHADLVASATHGRSPSGRLVHGGIAWRMLALSPVPVLLRHFDEPVEPEPENVMYVPSQRRILVPLDGSELAETAIPFALSLAMEWNASIYLAEVIPAVAPVYAYVVPPDGGYQTEIKAVRTYLDKIAMELPVPVHTHVFLGGVVEEISRVAGEASITDVVLASHGRTGLSRVVLGSVADELVHHLNLPIIVIPAMAARALEEAVPQQALSTV